MSLTIGTAPFGQRPAGKFNFDAPREGVLYVEESPRWVRARLGGQTVADSRHPRLVHEAGRLPVLYFPEEDVDTELLEPSERSEEDPVKGRAIYFSVGSVPDAAWSWSELPGLIAFEWSAMDEWLEEDEALFGHVRDPYHRIDVRRTSRHVVVRVGGEVVADSTRTRVLFESGLPPRWYFPAEDVRMELLEESDTDTVCAYKGHASYWSVGEEDDLVWTYREPEHDAVPVKDMLAFFNERVDLEVDGEVEGRPRTQWSRD